VDTRPAAGPGHDPAGRTNRDSWACCSLAPVWRIPWLYKALPVVAMTLTTAAPAMVPATPKTEATTAADTEASVLAPTCVPLTPSPGRARGGT